MDSRFRPAFVPAGTDTGRSSDEVAALLQSRLRTLGAILLPLGLILAILGGIAGLFSRQAGISSQLDAVILRCLVKKPSERYASTAELEWALTALE